MLQDAVVLFFLVFFMAFRSDIPALLVLVRQMFWI